MGEGTQWLTATASHCSPTSPPPFMAGFAEVEVDLETGETKVVDYVGVVDCGTVINKNLARVQAEGRHRPGHRHGPAGGHQLRPQGPDGSTPPS